ncbi:hypothetical protein NKH18_20350 [Streptomyces sp. M10(2022)]
MQLRAVHDTVTPAFGVPVHIRERTPAHHARRPDSGNETLPARALWLLLGLAAGLFWVPLIRLAPARGHRLTGTGLLDALPPLTVTAGLLLIVLYSAAVALYRPRFALIGSGLLVTVAALHTARCSWASGPPPPRPTGTERSPASWPRPPHWTRRPECSAPCRSRSS